MIAPIRPPRSNTSVSPMPSRSVKIDPAQGRAGEAEQDGGEEAARVVAGHECLADEAGHQAEDECADHRVLR